MFKSYFYLVRAAEELNNLLAGKTLLDCYTQERDKLFLHIPLDEQKYFHLIISTNPQDFHISLKDEHRKAKKNTFSFFSELLLQKILSVKVVYGDRIIFFELERGNFIILFRGGKSNCFFRTKDGSLKSFKKISDEQIKLLQKEFEECKKLDSSNSLTSVLQSIANLVEIKALPFLSKEIIRNIENTNQPVLQFNSIVDDILYGQIVVGSNIDNSETVFLPLSFLDTSKEMEVELLDSYFDAVSKYFSINRSSSKTVNAKKEIEKFIERELERTTSKLNNLKGRIDVGSRDTEYQNIGELLLSNLNLLTKGQKELTLEDWKTKTSITIKIDAKLTPQQNVNVWFDKARSEKIEYDKSKMLFEKTLNKYDQLKQFESEIENELTVERLGAIKKELKMNQQQNISEDKKDKLPFRHFVIEDKYHFYIGKDSKNNDMLTTKFAKQNDFWFHARSVAGSHGVLRVENTKEAIPKRVLEKAASITAFYSKSKTAKLAPVTYTLKKYVTKNSRHEVGQVSVLKENVLLVRPEIPADCIYIED